jgi:hypothetical protein
MVLYVSNELFIISSLKKYHDMLLVCSNGNFEGPEFVDASSIKFLQEVINLKYLRLYRNFRFLRYLLQTCREVLEVAT